MDYETKICVWLCIVLIPIFIVLIRLIVVLPITRKLSNGNCRLNELKGIDGKTVMILLGSGGHTGEMIRIVSTINWDKLNRIWLTSSGDTTSILKARDFENLLGNDSTAKYIQLHRARKVGENLVSSAYNTVKSIVLTLPMLLSLPQLPDVLLVNGPGTSVPLAYILFILKFLGLGSTKIIYIESLARVDQLSLSGKLILPIANRFIVQWEQLSNRYYRTEYYGILI